jgi:hypothetical protein
MRLSRFPIAALLAVAAVGLSATSAAALPHRTAHSPCDKHGNGKSVNDEGDNGVLHCSAIWSVAPTGINLDGIGDSPPPSARPADCAHGSIIKGTGNPAGQPDLWSPHWFYTPEHGQYVVWDPRYYHAILEQRDGGAVNITPQFRNWNARPWANRYYFYCNVKR